MKRDWNRLDLKDAFHTIPDACSRALMEAARSAGREAHHQRRRYRIALAAALMLVGTVAAAFAATQLGWTELFSREYGMDVPRSAQEALEITQSVAYEVGPVTITYQQLLADGHMVLSAAQAQLTNGGDALYADDAAAQDGEAVPQSVADHYGLAVGSSWLEAAQELDLPLYSVRALVELPSAYSQEAMESALWQEDGSITYFNMLLLDSAMESEPLPVTLYMQVTQHDPVTGESLETWQAQEDATVSMTPLLAEKDYLPSADTVLDGLTLEKIHGELYATGVYLTASFTAAEGMTQQEALHALYDMTMLDAEGAPLPMGLNLSVQADVQALPQATLEVSAALEALPRSVMLSAGEQTVTAE